MLYADAGTARPSTLIIFTDDQGFGLFESMKIQSLAFPLKNPYIEWIRCVNVRFSRLKPTGSP
jgi:hypothetical protein